MKKKYIQPIMASESFIPNEYISTCYDVGNGMIVPEDKIVVHGYHWVYHHLTDSYEQVISGEHYLTAQEGVYGTVVPCQSNNAILLSETNDCWKTDDSGNPDSVITLAGIDLVPQKYTPAHNHIHKSVTQPNHS